MISLVGDYDFLNMKAQKYWSFPSSYDKEKRQQTLNTMLYSNEFIAAEKKDGYFELLIKNDNGDITMRARDKGVNGWICKEDRVPHLFDFFNSLPNGTVLVTEVYLPNKTSKNITSILGCAPEKAIARQQKNEPLHMYCFDCLAYSGKVLINTPITERITYLNKINCDYPYVERAIYWDNPEDIHNNWLDILAKGGEGVVLTRKDNFYEPGKRTARHTLKLKKELKDTIDVFLTGKWKEPTKLYTGKEIETWPYWYDDITDTYINTTLNSVTNIDGFTPVTRLYFYNMAGAVEIATYINGKETPIGWISGIDDEVRLKIVEDSSQYRGKVVELQAMEIDRSNAIPTLRHAKIVKWRPDKNKEDCIWH
jgi:hypothetical protein